MSQSTPLGFVGIGNMGVPMAAHLLAARHGVTAAHLLANHQRPVREHGDEPQRAHRAPPAQAAVSCPRQMRPDPEPRAHLMIKITR